MYRSLMLFMYHSPTHLINVLLTRIVHVSLTQSYYSCIPQSYSYQSHSYHFFFKSLHKQDTRTNTEKYTEEAQRNALYFENKENDRVQYKAVCNLGRIHLDRVHRRVEREEQRKQRKREDQERNRLEERVEQSLDRVFKEAYESTGIILDHRVKDKT